MQSGSSKKSLEGSRVISHISKLQMKDTGRVLSVSPNTDEKPLQGPTVRRLLLLVNCVPFFASQPLTNWRSPSSQCLALWLWLSYVIPCLFSKEPLNHLLDILGLSQIDISSSLKLSIHFPNQVCHEELDMMWYS